jgi:low affinity Fe/Cu permease
MTVTETQQNAGKTVQNAQPSSPPSGRNGGRNHAKHHELGRFERFARATAILAGHPAGFLAACTLVVVWLATGPIFGFSDTWQLVINTRTTIITFLIVFLIQQSQNRDTLAVQVKLAELIIAVKKADNTVAIAEDLSAHDLAEIHAEYCRKAEQALHHLETKHGKEAARAALKKAAAVGHGPPPQERRGET